MNNSRGQNPDVNTYYPDVNPGEDPGVTDGNNESSDIERNGDDTIPVPPNSRPAAPVEEPPGTEGAPVGDVDDSPKRIV